MPEKDKQSKIDWLKRILPRKRYWVLFAFVSFVVLGVLAKLDPSLAQGTINPDEVGNGIVRFFVRGNFIIAELCIQAAVFALEFFIDLARYNDFLGTPVVELGWLMIRDVANMFFVVVLLVIAVGTILGLEQYEWNKTLVKFVLAALLVNFSNLIFGLIIDVAHVFTITFVNAIAAAAGGNLIAMFKMQKAFEMITNYPVEQKGNYAFQLFAASLMAFFMAFMAMVTIGAYLIVMIMRVVVLWTLIILSPLAFILNVIPQTESYAKQIWDKFVTHVLVAPVMVFFLWLAFATLGSGDVVNQMHLNIVGGEATGFTTTESSSAAVLAAEATEVVKPSLSLSKASSWENLSSFMIAIAFLMVGIGVVGQMGVVGGGLVEKGLEFGKNAVTIASGYALGKKLVGGTVDGLSKGATEAGKGILMHAPVVGGEKWKMRAKNEWAATKKWYRNLAAGISPQSIEKQRDLEAEKSKLGVADPGERLAIRKNIENLEAEKGTIDDQLQAASTAAEEIANDGTASDEDKVKAQGRVEDLKARKEQIGKLIEEKKEEGLGVQGPEREKIEQNIKKLEKEAEKASKKASSGVIAAASRSSLSLEKRLAKTEKEAESVREVAWKRTGSEAGGIFMQRRTNMFTGKSITVDAQDRIIRGMLEGEKMRSGAKDSEYENMGKQMILGNSRFKDGKFEDQHGTMAHRIAQHKLAGRHWENAAKALESEANMKIVMTYENKDKIQKLRQEMEGLGTDLELDDKAKMDDAAKGLSAAEREKIRNTLQVKQAELRSLAKQSIDNLGIGDEIDKMGKAIDDDQARLENAKQEILESDDNQEIKKDKLAALKPEELALNKKRAKLNSLINENTKEWTSMSGVSYDSFLQTQSVGKINEDAYKSMEEKYGKQRLGDVYSEAVNTDNLGGEWESGAYSLDKGIVKDIKVQKEKKKQAETKLGDLRKDRNELHAQLQKAKSDEETLGTGGAEALRDEKLTAFGEEVDRIEKLKTDLGDLAVSDEVVMWSKKQSSDSVEQGRIVEAKQRVGRAEQIKKEIEEFESKRAEKEAETDEFIGKSDDELQAFVAEKIRNSGAQMTKIENEIKKQEGIRIEVDAALVEAEGSLSIDAKMIRKGDDTAQKIIEDKIKEFEAAIESENAKVEVPVEISAKGKSDQDKYIKDNPTELQKEYQQKIKKLQNGVRSMSSGSRAAWQYGVAKGTEADVARHHQYNHNELLTVAEQREVHDKRGISTPSSALTEMVEQFEKDFKEMSYDQYVESVGTMMGTFVAKRKRKEEVSVADKASMMGFFRRGFKESWIDDAIIGVMENSGTRADIGTVIGWKDNNFSPDKIGDVVNLFQSAGDIDFTKEAVVLRELIDEGLNAASKEMQMSVEGVFEGIKTGEFKNTKGTKVITADFEENIRKHLKSINRDLTEEQDKLLKKLLTGQAKNTLDRYLQVSEENQAAFQYMGNLRNEAIANGHVENSGHSLYKDIGGGKSMYIASGVRMAHGHGYGDFNKMDVRRRLQAHPHVGFNLNGSTQVGTSCRTDAFETMTKNADVRSMSAVTSRLVNVATGIGAVESNTDYLGSGSFDPMSSVQTQEAHEEHYDYEFAKFKHKTKFDGASESKKKKLRRLFAAQSYVKNSLLPQMRTNMPVALMLQAANTTDVSPLEASNGGKMNLTLPHRNEKGEMTETTFRTVDRFLEVADYGGFGDVGGNLPSFTPGTVKPEDLNTLLDDDDGGS